MPKWTGKKVAVLYGGRSSEREVSLRTGAACADALAAKGLRRRARRRGPRGRRAAARAAGRRRVRRAARPLGRGRLHPGAARVDGHPVHAARASPPPRSGWTRSSRSRCSRRSASTSSTYRAFAPARAGAIAAARPAVRLPRRREARRRGLLGRRPDREGRGEARATACAEAATYKGDVLVERYVKGTRGERRGARREGARRHRDRARARVLRLRREVHRRHDQVPLPGAHPRGAPAARHGGRGAAHRGLGCSGVSARRLHRRAPTARRSSSR